MKRRYLLLRLWMMVTVVSVASALTAQRNPGAVPGDTADFPYWIRMMDDPSANYFATVSAFEKYWAGRPVTKGCGWKVFKRWEYILRDRVAPDGTKPAPDAVYNEWMKSARAPLSSAGAWTSLGPAVIPAPGPAGYEGLGRLNVVAFHPANPDILYAGAPSGGFWMTADQGATWTTPTDNLPTPGVSAIAVSYANPSVILMGTGDRDHGDAPGMGVFRSSDGGLTWTASKTGMGNVTVCGLVQHPANALIYLAATSGGIFRSTDGGFNWTLTASGSFRDLCLNPGNPAIVYAESEGDFYRSGNNGLSFIQITSGLTAGQRGAIAVSPANPGYVYFVQSDNTSGFKGLYRSADNGLTFNTRSESPNLLDWSCDGSGTGGQGWYDLSIAADPANAETVYVGGVDVWKSSDGGSTWAINSHWYGGCSVPAVHADCHCLVFSPVNGRLYAGNDGGIYHTSDGGATWTDCTVGMTIGQIYRIGQSRTDPDKTICGFQDNGTYTHTADGWVATGGGDGMECAVDHQDPAYTYHTLYYGSIYRKYNNGSELQIAGEGVFGIDESGDWVTPFTLDESDPHKMFVGYKNVWRCSNVTVSTPVWTKISTGETAHCRVLEQSPANLSLVYVVRSGTMKRTVNANDASPVWSSCALPGGYTPTDLEAHPTDPDIVYATAGHKVYKSVNMGASWNQVAGTLPDIPVNCIVYDKNSQEGIYIGTQTGVMFRNASMSGWVSFSNGLPVVDVRELEIFYHSNPANNCIVAATYGRGLWKSDLYYPPDSPPVANFSYTPDDLCPGDAVQFTDLSLNSPTTWSWTFSPATVTFLNSTSASSRNPSVQFNDNATYTVTLTVSNAFGSSAADTVIVAGGSAPPLTGDFETGAIPAGWRVVNPDNGLTWQTDTTAGTPPGTVSGFMNFYDYYPAGSLDDLVLPPVNLEGTLNPWLKFRVAYRRWGADNSDGLRVFLSFDCGATWEAVPVYDKAGTDLATGPDMGDPFIPSTSSDWRLDSVSLREVRALSVTVKFQAVNGWGNNLYLDDISLAENSSLTLQNLTFGSGNPACYDAAQTLTAGGLGTPVLVETGGELELAAGQRVRLLPDFGVAGGGYLLARIAVSGDYCSPAALAPTASGMAATPPVQQAGSSPFTLFPNPAGDRFTLAWKEGNEGTRWEVEIFGMTGERRLSLSGCSGPNRVFDVSGWPPGIYMVRATCASGAGVVKLVKQ